MPDWSKALRQQLTNAVLARYAIPVEVRPSVAPDGSFCWEANVSGGTFEAALDRMHALQDRIMRRISKHGTVSRQEALFMHASQWFEWTFMGDENHPENEELMELIDRWATFYVTLGERFLN